MTRHAATMTVIVLIASLAAEASWADEQNPAGKELPRPRLTLSREVTFFTEPLAPDGLIDYAAALNARHGQGVTPENNAAVALLRAMGRGDMDEKEFAELCQRLGIDVLPDEGDYFVSSDKFFEEMREAFDRDKAATARQLKMTPTQLRKQLDVGTDWVETYERCQQSPWTADDEPILAAWLKHNAKPLQRFSDGSELRRFYVPCKSGTGINGLSDTTVSISAMRISDSLRVRAMLRVSDESTTSQAWSDTLVLRRWATRLADGGMLIDQSLGLYLQRAAAANAVRVLTHGAYKSDALVTMERQWNAIGDETTLVSSFAISERCFILEAMNSVARGSPKSEFLEAYPRVAAEFQAFRRHRAARCMSALLIDVNATYRGINAVYDDLERIARLPTFRERIRAVEQLQIRTDHRASPRNVAITLFTIPWLDLPARRTAVGQLLSGTMTSQTIPVMTHSLSVEQTRRTEIRLVPAVFALARHRAAHGAYPERLDQLVPAFLDKLPADDFGDGPLKYQRRDDGAFELYSVGLNGKDDGGRSKEPLVDTTATAAEETSGDSDETGVDDDDLVIRIGGIR